MGVYKNVVTQMKSRIAGMSKVQRIAIALLGLSMMAGGGYLSMGRGGQDLAAVLAGPMQESELISAASMLASHGIDAQTRDRKLFVPNSALAQARAVLAYEGLLGRDLVAAFEQVCREDGVWRTQEQDAKRWQAAKMTTLSHIIGMFPPVRSATVILEAGQPHGLGRPAQAPTAAVNVTLKDGHKMTPHLIEAIADLVTGSVAGMSRQDVRIVDNTGRSHRIDQGGRLSAEDGIEVLRQAEAYYAQRIRSSLSYIENIVIGVQVKPDPENRMPQCTMASVSVPRSYLINTSRLGHVQELSDADLTLESGPQLSKIRQTVLLAIGATSQQDVRVDWHYDVAPEAASAQAGLVIDPATIGASVVVLAMLGIGINSFRRRLRLAGSIGQEESQQKAPSHGPVEASSSAMAMIERMDVNSVAEFLQGEHPQIIAIVLRSLRRETCASVLSRFNSQEQAEVAKRLSCLHKIDDGVLDQIEKALLQRLLQWQHSCQSIAMPSAVGQMRQQFEPDQKRMIQFNDIAAVGVERLEAVLPAVPFHDLATALYAADKDVRRHVLSSLDSDLAKLIRRRMDAIGPVRLSEVEAAQESILHAVERQASGLYVAEQSMNAEAIG